jgi:hypothetical protein
MFVNSQHRSRLFANIRSRFDASRMLALWLRCYWALGRHAAAHFSPVDLELSALLVHDPALAMKDLRNQPALSSLELTSLISRH